LLLLDEAFSALDYQTRLAVTDDVYKILKAQKQTAIIVTHDIPESISMSDRVLILSRRPAVIKRILDIDFGTDKRTPLIAREHKNFSLYFNTIWKELDVHD
jgi:NitT/TauT family transport system ATP-binding protein